MALRTILTVDDPTLKKTSRVVTEFNNRLHQLIDDMHETLIEANGLGLAAPQVGVLRRVALIVDIDMQSEPPEEKTIELINPEIIEQSGTQEGSEGCLSIPGVYGIVCRPSQVTIRAQDRFGETFEITCTGMTARAACHEIDHLNGVVFTSIAEHILTEEELEKMHEERMQEAYEQEDSL